MRTLLHSFVRLTLLLALAAAPVWAQATTGDDLVAETAIARDLANWSSGTAVPATCTVGDFFEDTDAEPGSRFLYCGETNVWSGVDSPWYNVVDYGADPTGASDSATEFQAAMTACAVPTRKGIVYIPPGNYKINTTLTMTGCGLVGDLPLSSVIINWDGSAGGTMLTVPTAAIGANRIENIDFRDGTARPGTMIHFTDLPDTFFRISDVGLRGFDNFGINVDAGWWNLHIRNFRCDVYNGWCIRLEPTATQAENIFSMDNFQAANSTEATTEGLLLYDMSVNDAVAPSPVHLSNGIFEVGAALTGDKAFISVHRINPGANNFKGVSFYLETLHFQDPFSTGHVFMYRDDDTADSESFVMHNIISEADALVGPSGNWDMVPPTPASGRIPFLNYHGIVGSIDVAIAHTFYGAASTDAADQSLLPADTVARWLRDAAGLTSWGDGTSAVDTNLFRAAANSLKTDDLFTADGGVTVGGGVLTVPVGSVGAPSITFPGDLTTGIWSDFASSIAFSTGGVQRVRIGGTFVRVANSGIFSNLTDTDTGMQLLSPDTLALVTGGVDALAIDANQNVTTGAASYMYKDSANVASATTTALPAGNLFHITGVTAITTLNTCDATNNGRLVNLIFDGVLTFTDGNNLTLAGNFTTAADSAILLVCDGTNWLEQSRTPAPGAAEVNNLEATDPPNVALNEVYVGTGAGTGAWVTPVPVAAGGIGVATLTDGGILIGNGTGGIVALGEATNGQIPIGDGTTDPVLAVITAEGGNEITITNGAGSIQLDVNEGNLDLAAIGGTLAAASNANAVRDRKGTYNIPDPVAGDDGDYQIEFPAACTLQEVACNIQGGTSQAISLYERARATPETGTTNMMTSTLSCVPGGAATTSFTDAALAANVPLALGIAAPSGTPTLLRVHVTCRTD